MYSPFIYRVENIRLGEFDLGGVLYHANYFHLYEAAREACLAAAGVPYCSLVALGQHLAVVESSSSFKLPIRYGEPITIELSFSQVRKSSFCAHYRLVAPESGKLAHEGKTKHAFVVTNSDSFRCHAMPEPLLKALEQHSHD